MDQQSFEACARTIFDHCCTLTGAVSGYVALLSDDGAENEVLFLEAGGMPCTVDESLPMPIRGLRAQAYESQKTVYDNDFMHSEWVRFMPEGHVALRNVMFVPLNIDGKTVGIIGMANKPDDFTGEDAFIASVFGDLAAIALRNSWQHELIEAKTKSLESALAEVKTLQGLLPMCCSCMKVRDDENLWQRVDEYIRNHTNAQISHGMCPDCIRKLYPEDTDEILRPTP